jgi:hypothetical protein
MAGVTILRQNRPYLGFKEVGILGRDRRLPNNGMDSKTIAIACFMSKTPRIDPPDLMKLVIGQPYRAQSDSQGISALTYKLFRYAVSRRIDQGQRLSHGGNPNNSFAGNDVSAFSWNANGNGRRDAIAAGSMRETLPSS